MKPLLLTTVLLLCLTSALAAPINFKDITSTNVVKTNDLLLLNSNLGGGSYATRTVTVQDYKTTGGAGIVPPFTNVSGTIKPASGQTTNRLEFTSGAADNATNMAMVVDTDVEWTDGSILVARNNGREVFRTGYSGQLVSGGTNSIDWWGSDISGIVLLSNRETSLGDYWFSDIAIRVATDANHYGMLLADIETNLVFLDHTVNVSNRVTGLRFQAEPGNRSSLELYYDNDASFYASPGIEATTVPYRLGTGRTHTSGNLVNVENNSTPKFSVDFEGNISTRGNTNQWAFNGKVTGATVTLTTTNYLEIVLNGVTNKVALVQ